MLRPGGATFLPRDVPHGFRVKGDTPARVLLIATRHEADITAWNFFHQPSSDDGIS